MSTPKNLNGDGVGEGSDVEISAARIEVIAERAQALCTWAHMRCQVSALTNDKIGLHKGTR